MVALVAQTGSSAVVGTIDGANSPMPGALGSAGLGQSSDGNRSRHLPLALLLLALTALFVFGGSRSHFYRPWAAHDWNSSASLAFAENLAAERGFLRFYRLPLSTASVYNRFPPGGVALVWLVTAPFGENFGAKILAARMLMLALFAGAALLACLALRRVLDEPWIAAGATAWAFSSFYCLYYSDMISTEVTMDLFAVMLVWHGMVLFVQDGRFRQLLVKTCLALLVGWHVYALLLAFIVLALAAGLRRACRAAGPRLPLARFLALASVGKPLALGAVAFGFGLLVLSFNLLTEYQALRPDSARELPTLRSMVYRTGISEDSPYAERVTFGNALAGGIYRVGAMMLPNPVADVLPNYPIARIHHPYGDWIVRGVLLVGALSLSLCVGALWFARQRLLLGSIALTGWCWALPMRANAIFHDFEAVFHIGVPLTTISLSLLWLRGRIGQTAVRGFAVAALAIFVVCNFQMSRLGRDAAEIRLQTEVREDFQAIRASTEAGSRVGVREDVIGFDETAWDAKPETALAEYGKSATGAHGNNVLGSTFALEYYLSGRPLLTRRPAATGVNEQTFAGADVFVTLGRAPGIDTLTPDNKRVFLYDRRAYLNQGQGETSESE